MSAIDELYARRNLVTNELNKLEKTVSFLHPRQSCNPLDSDSQPSPSPCAVVQIFDLETAYLGAEFSQMGTVLKVRAFLVPVPPVRD